MKITVVFLSALMMLAAPVVQGPSPTKDSAAVRLFSSRTGNEVKLVIDPNPNNEPDVPKVMMKICRERGARFPILAMFVDNNTVSDMYNVLHVAGNAGCQNIQTIMAIDNVGLFRLKISKIEIEDKM